MAYCGRDYNGWHIERRYNGWYVEGGDITDGILTCSSHHFFGGGNPAAAVLGKKGG